MFEGSNLISIIGMEAGYKSSTAIALANFIVKGKKTCYVDLEGHNKDLFDKDVDVIENKNFDIKKLFSKYDVVIIDYIELLNYRAEELLKLNDLVNEINKTLILVSNNPPKEKYIALKCLSDLSITNSKSGNPKKRIRRHPDWENCIDKNTTKLIVGSAPPDSMMYDDAKGNKYFDFFYGSTRNKLWTSVMEDLGYEKITSKEDAIRFLKNRNIGIMDIYKIFTRKNEGAKDEDIIPLEYYDINKVLKDYPNIKEIYTTSEYVTEELNNILKDKRVVLHTLVSPTQRKYNTKKKYDPNYLDEYKKLFK